MELLTLLIAFAACFLGLLLLMSLSLADIEALLDAKYIAENSAQMKNHSEDGRDIGIDKSWKYSEWLYQDKQKGTEKVEIPFLLGDLQYTGKERPIMSFYNKFNDANASEPAGWAENNPEWQFSRYDTVTPVIAENFPADNEMSLYNMHSAAELVKGSTTEINKDKQYVLFQDKRYFNRQKIYQSIEKFVGVKLGKIRLDEAESNQVYMPVIKVLNK